MARHKQIKNSGRLNLSNVRLYSFFFSYFQCDVFLHVLNVQVNYFVVVKNDNFPSISDEKYHDQNLWYQVMKRNALLSLYFVAPIYKYKYLPQLMAWCFRNYSVYAVYHCCYLEARLFRWLWCYGWNTLHSLIFKYHYSSSPNNNGFSF